jgi:hypothetical protein
MSLPPAGTALEKISEAALEAAELLTQISYEIQCQAYSGAGYR